MIVRQPIASALVVIALAALPLHAWTAPTSRASWQDAGQVRDMPSSSVGTASVRGTVVVDDDKRGPLRHVTVSISRAGQNDVRETATDDQGTYVFDNLPDGTYTLNAAKGSYVGVNYGAAKVGLSGTPIPLTNGQVFTALPMALAHGAVITGHVTDPRGRPQAGILIEASQFSLVNGERRPRGNAGTVMTATTDSHGVYRIFGLVSGDYVVSASMRFSATQEIREVTPAELEWGQREVEGVVTAGVATVSTAGPAATKAFVYAPTFYPGTADVGNAAVVSLARGEERQGVDFAVHTITTGRISGIVLGADGTPAANVLVVRVGKQASPFVQTFDPTGTSRTGPSGAFSYSSVKPGEYTITARGAAGGAPASTGPPNGLGLPSGPLTMWGTADVSMTGDDVSDVTIRLQPGMTVSGKVVFDGTAPPPDPTRVEPRLTAQADTASVTVNGATQPAHADGTFTLEGVTPGAYRVTAAAVTTAGGRRWNLESAVINGKDVLDAPFEMRAGEDVNGVVVTFSDRDSRITGTLTDASGHPGAQYLILAFPVDRRNWIKGSRWIKSARAGVDGTFTLASLPPGEYYLSALTELDASDQYDPTYLDQLVPAAIKTVLAEGETHVQNLRVGGS